MTYQEAVEYLFDQLPMYQRTGASAYKNNLDNTLKLDAWFDHPHTRFKTIHVAGTNGKGSVSHMLASVLQEAGYKTGLYTSPHLRDFRERIRVNGLMISEDEVVRFVTENRTIIDDVSPSFFEMTVAMAFNHFANEKVDVAVIEVGLGGRLDSTNIITPELSIITNIGLDHMSLLGNTLESIASEKAGIIKSGIPVVIGRTQEEIHHVYLKKTEACNTSMRYADEAYKAVQKQMSTNAQTVDILSKAHGTIADLKLPLPGNYQLENIQTVVAATSQLIQSGFTINEQHLRLGVENVIVNTGLEGRWQILSHAPLTICDTGHNEDGIRSIVTQLEQMKYEQLHMVIGVVSDKDVDSMLQLLPKNAAYYFTRANIPRSLDAEELKNKALKAGLQGNSYPNVPLAMDAAKKNAKVNDLIFIGGSTFVVADAI
ncbi:bifunctional folylpolyglutamate synthase/dihydrofolate synthase [Alkaliflexus imshenetskii]|uniref:bifunctional folylpolyglutamate synthase/dihydrofolate synthase n=1 Tax=Alkaliflexus imshenetskii TaxID=286730 RepID=UPI00047BEDD5|nr:folylpolyglutamate synthase/dihydrofolate synthase family protein [Alkaliflexus imshenetskii]